MSGQELALINNRFSSVFSIGDTIEKDGVVYEISGEGRTHVICINKNFKDGKDIFLEKEECLKLARK